jgi:hypothetical protein
VRFSFPEGLADASDPLRFLDEFISHLQANIVGRAVAKHQPLPDGITHHPYFLDDVLPALVRVLLKRSRCVCVCVCV